MFLISTLFAERRRFMLAWSQIVPLWKQVVLASLASGRYDNVCIRSEDEVLAMRRVKHSE